MGSTEMKLAIWLGILVFKALFKKDLTPVKQSLVNAKTKDDVENVIKDAVLDTVADGLGVDDETSETITDLVATGKIEDVDEALKKPSVLSGIMDVIGNTFKAIFGVKAND
jgi:hypothetical protein